MEHASLTDSDLLQRATRGDDSAFATLYRKHAQTLMQWLYRACGSRQTAEDVLHTVFANLLKPTAQLSDIRNVKAYLFGAAHNELLYHTRSRHGETQLPALHETFLRAEGFDRRDDYLDLLDALHRLPAEQTEIILLHSREGLTFDEIAQILQLPPDTVSYRYYSGREKLKHLLADKS